MRASFAANSMDVTKAFVTRSAAMFAARAAKATSAISRCSAGAALRAKGSSASPAMSEPAKGNEMGWFLESQRAIFVFPCFLIIEFACTLTKRPAVGQP